MKIDLNHVSFLHFSSVFNFFLKFTSLQNFCFKIKIYLRVVVIDTSNSNNKHLNTIGDFACLPVFLSFAQTDLLTWPLKTWPLSSFQTNWDVEEETFNQSYHGQLWVCSCSGWPMKGDNAFLLIILIESWWLSWSSSQFLSAAAELSTYHKFREILKNIWFLGSTSFNTDS